MSVSARPPAAIPSYDDLTPPIPDVLPSNQVPQLALFLGRSGAPPEPLVVDPPAPPAPVPEARFACLRGAPDTTGALLALAQDFSPRIMRQAPGEVVLDVSGLGRLIGDADAIARELRRGLGDVPAAVALAPTQVAARLLAREPGVAAIGGLAVGTLRELETLPPNLGVRDRERPYETLERWGITTLAQLAALPAAGLSSRLGRRGVAMQRLAQGLDPRPFVPDPDVPRYFERLELEWPIDGLEPLSFVLARLLERLCEQLERADRGAAAIRLELRLTDRTTSARLLQLPAAMRDARVLRTLLLLDLEAAASELQVSAAGAQIDVVSIEIDPAPSRITQFSLLERAVPSPETVATLTARLSALVGESRAGSARLIDSHQPDAFEMTPFAIAAAPTSAPAADPDAGAVAGMFALRRQRVPPAVRVNVAHGRPVYLAPSRRGIPSGAIVQAAGPWRTSGGWWLVDPRRAVPPLYGEGAWDRNEWDVALAAGAVCRIFEDRATGRWFFEGTYD